MEKFMTLLQEKLTPIANFCGTERHFAWLISDLSRTH